MLIQFGVRAQGSDVEGWVEILFIAVMATLWLVGGLIKTIGSKRLPQQRQPEGLAQEQRRQGETWQQRLARKAEEMQRAAVVRRPEVAEAEGGQDTGETRQRRLTQRLYAVLQGVRAAQLIAEPPIPPKPPEPKPRGDDEVLIRHGDSDDLRKVILSYEILSKPIGMRDPFERIVSF